MTTSNGGGTAGNPRTELGKLVRFWRERLDPASIPGHGTSGRRKAAASQEDIANLIGVSAAWYRRLERGEIAGYSDDFLDRTATVLCLNEGERTLLYLYAVQRDPAPRPPTPLRLTPPLRHLVEQQHWPAYVSNESWDVVAYNHHMADWFPWVRQPDSNIMRWALTSADARRQLHKWETDWAPTMLAQMRIANARQPGNPRLTNLVREILSADSLTRDLWARESLSQPRADGEQRQLYLPNQPDLIDIELVCLSPLRSAGSQVTLLLPLDN